MKPRARTFSQSRRSLEQAPIFLRVSLDRGIAATLHATGRQEAFRVLGGRARRESSNATGPKGKRTNAISFIFGASHGDFTRRRSVAPRSFATHADRTCATSLERCVEGGDA